MFDHELSSSLEWVQNAVDMLDALPPTRRAELSEFERDVRQFKAWLESMLPVPVMLPVCEVSCD